MENTLHPFQLANKFFYKFYNYNLEDSEMLNNVPPALYAHVSRELIEYKKHNALSIMNTMQFNTHLFNTIKSNYTALHEELISNLSE